MHPFGRGLDIMLRVAEAVTIAVLGKVADVAIARHQARQSNDTRIATLEKELTSLKERLGE